MNPKAFICFCPQSDQQIWCQDFDLQSLTSVDGKLYD